MKVGADNKPKTWIAAGLALLALYFALTRLPAMFTTPPQPAVARVTGPQLPAVQPQRKRITGKRGKSSSAAVAPALDPRLRLDLLKISESTEYGGSGRNIFRAESEPPKEIPQPVKSPLAANNPNTAPPGPAPPPPPPPIPLRFFGIASKQGEPKRALLADGEDVFLAKEGDIVDRHYKVNKIGVNSVEITDVLNNNTQTIPLTAQT